MHFLHKKNQDTKTFFFSKLKKSGRTFHSFRGNASFGKCRSNTVRPSPTLTTSVATAGPPPGSTYLTRSPADSRRLSSSV